VREIRNVYKIFIRNSERKFKYRWEDLNESEKVMDWIQLAQDRQVTESCKCGNEPLGYIEVKISHNRLR
jgi:hypothetical protein